MEYIVVHVYFSHLKQLVNTLVSLLRHPLKHGLRLSAKATTHCKKNYHLLAATKMEEFLARYENPSQTVNTLLDNEAKRRMVNNAWKGIESFV